MIRTILAGALALAFSTTAMAAPQTAAAKPAVAKSVQCKDTKGKFIRCPAPVARAVAKSPVAVVVSKPTATKGVPGPAAKRCRDAKGRFAKCGTPGTK